ncbi:2OG-Fe dioxygenase family protein [Rhodanobacter lindaniclasticus]
MLLPTVSPHDSPSRPPRPAGPPASRRLRLRHRRTHAPVAADRRHGRLGGLPRQLERSGAGHLPGGGGPAPQPAPRHVRDRAGRHDERQPHQAHWQSARYNPLQGDIQRWFLPIRRWQAAPACAASCFSRMRCSPR